MRIFIKGDFLSSYKTLKRAKRVWSNKPSPPPPKLLRLLPCYNVYHNKLSCLYETNYKVIKLIWYMSLLETSDVI